MMNQMQEQQLKDCLLGYLDFLKPQSPVEEAMILFVARQDWLLQQSPYPLTKREEKLLIKNMKSTLERLFQFRGANKPSPPKPAATGKVLEMPKRKPVSAVSSIPPQDFAGAEPRERSGVGRYQLRSIDLRREAA
jgi:hypothetical protein